MHKLVKLNCLLGYNDREIISRDAVQNLRSAVLAPAVYVPRIEEALQNLHFSYHRTCSFSNLIRECDVDKGETLLMYWGCEVSDSKITMSLSSGSSVTYVAGQNSPNKEVRSITQQTDISCRNSPGIRSPVLDADEQRLRRGRIADSVTFSSPASSLLQPAGRSMSILGSVCALLLNKQVTQAAKEVSSLTGSVRSDNMCRICFGGQSAECLVRPCDCRGTVAAVHRSCLERWLLQAATSYCELCRHHYIVSRSHKWSWARSLAEWAVSRHGQALACDAWRALALGACSALGTARALQACDAALQAGARRGGGIALAANLFSSLLIGIIGALNGLLTTWMLLKIQEHQLSWRAWRDSTLHVRVCLAGEEEAPSSHASDVTIVGTATVDRSTNVADPFMTPNFKSQHPVAEPREGMTFAFICFGITSLVCAVILMTLLVSLDAQPRSNEN